MRQPNRHPFRCEFDAARDEIRARVARRKLLSAVVTSVLVGAALLVAVWLAGHLDQIFPSARQAAAAVRP